MNQCHKHNHRQQKRTPSKVTRNSFFDGTLFVFCSLWYNFICVIIGRAVHEKLFVERSYSDIESR